MVSAIRNMPFGVAPGMLWVDRVGDRRSRAILARHSSENKRHRRNNDENEPAPRTGFRRATERRNDVKKRKRNNAKYESCTLINLEEVGHDCNPSVAALRLYSHGRNDHSHRVLDSTIHIVGIRTISHDFGYGVGDDMDFLLSNYTRS
jgi:hypothetical protein